MAAADTPLMRQYFEVKSRYPDSLVFFRMGDFYELFSDDAVVAAKTLEIALTSRNKSDPNAIPMCGVPHHSSVNYIHRLVNQGHKVAICEQLEDPAASKGLVKRDVIRVISPGTRLDPDSLEAKAPNYTHAAKVDGTTVFWSTVDFTTGSFVFGTFPSVEDWQAYAASQNIAEALFPDSETGTQLLQTWKTAFPHILGQLVPSFYFDSSYASDRLREQFSTASLSAVHPSLSAQTGAAGALVKYFQETQKVTRIPSALKIELWGEDDVMELDAGTVRALELLPMRTTAGRSSSMRDVSLLTLLDRTKTAMGGRLFREWLLRPLKNLSKIKERQDQVAGLLESYSELASSLGEIYDLERLLSRVSLGSGASASSRELASLCQSILGAEELIEKIQVKGLQDCLKTALHSSNGALLSLARELTPRLADTLPLTVRDGGIFKKGFQADLDELINLAENGEQWLVEFEARERAATGISSLKVRFNRVFGYYIEITKANLKSAPAHYIRKQTMVGGERYITEELKNFEEKILTAEKKRCDMEYALFREYCGRFAELSSEILALARAIAQVDSCAALAEVASTLGYVRPTLDDSRDLAIVEGWHPTLAVLMSRESGANGGFVPNSLTLDDPHHFWLITGPNMGGKSTVMRQTALITLMAQMGSFVPAQKANIGIVDRIFTRIGANDNMADGASTFMVEMSEMSYIVRNATKQSLILIDEVGRGTSTYDGMSLAWALASDIASRIRARTLFATHYHELTQLSEHYKSILNTRVAVALSEDQRSIRFLYRLESGVAERSYGILVARLAGLPETVLLGAEEMLAQLESRKKNLPVAKRGRGSQQTRSSQDDQPLLFAMQEVAPRNRIPEDSELEKWLKTLEINSITPLEALTQLAQWKEKMRSEPRSQEQHNA